MTDENTESNQAPKKEVDQGDPGPTVSKSMKDTSSKINDAGVEGLPSDEPPIEAEIVPPEPKEKTPQEMMENPEQVLEGVETKDALPLTGDNPEMLESMKNKNADGDVEIPLEETAETKRMAVGYKPALATVYNGHKIVVWESAGSLKTWFIWKADGEQPDQTKYQSPQEAMKAAKESIDDISMSRLAKAESFDHNGVDCTVSQKQGKWIASVEGGDAFVSPPFIDKNKAIAWIKHFIDLHDDDVGMEAHLKEPGE